MDPQEQHHAIIPIARIHRRVNRVPPISHLVFFCSSSSLSPDFAQECVQGPDPGLGNVGFRHDIIVDKVSRTVNRAYYAARIERGPSKRPRHRARRGFILKYCQCRGADLIATGRFSILCHWRYRTSLGARSGRRGDYGSNRDHGTTANMTKPFLVRVWVALFCIRPSKITTHLRPLSLPSTLMPYLPLCGYRCSISLLGRLPLIAQKPREHMSAPSVSFRPWRRIH